MHIFKKRLFAEFRFGSVYEWMGAAPREVPAITLGRRRAVPA